MAGFLELLKEQRWDDHRYYHHSRINQSLHLVSAMSFLCAYVLRVQGPRRGRADGWLVAMTSRQVGHFFFEPKGYDDVNQATHEHKEEIKVGYNMRRKIVLLAIWALSPLVLLVEPTLFGILEPHRSAERVRAPRRQAVAGARRRRPAVPHGPAVLRSRTCRPAWSGRRRSSPTRSTTSSFTIDAPAHLLRGELIDRACRRERRGSDRQAQAAPSACPIAVHDGQHLAQDLAPDRLVGAGGSGPPPAVPLHRPRRGQEALGDRREIRVACS